MCHHRKLQNFHKTTLQAAQYKLLSVLGVKPRPSESVVSCARGGFGGLTVSGELGFLAPGDDGDFM